MADEGELQIFADSISVADTRVKRKNKTRVSRMQRAISVYQDEPLNVLSSARKKLLGAGVLIGDLPRNRDEWPNLCSQYQLTTSEVAALWNYVARPVGIMRSSEGEGIASLQGCLDGVESTTIEIAVCKAPKCFWNAVKDRDITTLNELNSIMECSRGALAAITERPANVTDDELLAIWLYSDSKRSMFSREINSALWNPNVSVDLIANHFLFMRLLVLGLKKLNSDVIAVAFRGVRVADDSNLMYQLDNYKHFFPVGQKICMPSFLNLTTRQDEALAYSDEMLWRYENVTGVNVSKYRDQDGQEVIVVIPPTYFKVTSTVYVDKRLVISLEQDVQNDVSFLSDDEVQQSCPPSMCTTPTPENLELSSDVVTCFTKSGSQVSAESLVSDVVAAMNGTLVVAQRAVKNLILYAAACEVNANQYNKVVASFLILKSQAQCVNAYGKKLEYFLGFGASIPSRRLNQLQNIGIVRELSAFLQANKFAIDSALVQLFKEYFNVDAVADFASWILGNQNKWRQDVLEALREPRLVCMTGTGVSCGIVNDLSVTWTGLLNEMLRKVKHMKGSDTVMPEAWDELDPESKAGILKQIVSTERPHLDYRQFISTIMMRINKPADNHELAMAISVLELPIATTNYDLILESSLGRFELNLTHPEVTSFCNHSDYVYHVHGVWYDASSVVLSDRDYENSQHAFEYAVGKLFFTECGDNHRSLLFIGCKDGMIDDHFKVLFREDPRFKHLRHFALLRESDIHDLSGNPVFQKAVKSGRLKPLSYGKNYDELSGYIVQLGNDKTAQRM
jgi:hypothetical protein